MKKAVLLLIFALLLVIQTQPLASAAPCSSVTYSAPSGSQNNIVFTFDTQYECGQYANGDWYVVVDGGGDVTITSITPAYSSGRNGWEINPSDPHNQGLDDRITTGGISFDPGLVPTLPRNVGPGSSVLKVVSRPNPPPSGDTTRLQFAVVLTVVGSAPGSPSETFRPPYFSSSKPTYLTSDIDWSKLPSLHCSNCPGAIGITEAEDRVRHVQLDHLWRHQQDLPPLDNMRSEYGAEMSRDWSEVILQLMLDDYSVNEKRMASIYMIQAGIDHAQVALSGGGWPAAAGHGLGRKQSVLFAAVMLNDDNLLDLLENPPLVVYGGETKSAFAENEQLYYGNNNAPLWGYYNGERTEEIYWSRFLTGSGHGGNKDPYEYVDGGDTGRGTCAGGQGGYQWVTSPPYKYSALVVQFLNAKKAYNSNAHLDYADRWVQYGHHTYPDPCATGPGTYGVDYGPDGSGGCILGAGRAHDSHHTENDCGQNPSSFGNEVWNAFRTDFGCMYVDDLAPNGYYQYNCDSVLMNCGDISSCGDYPNQRALDYDPCNLDCGSVPMGDIYVDNSVSDCTSYDPYTRTCGSGSDRAFDTIQEAADIVNPGETVIVMTGNYPESVTLSRGGNIGNKVTFSSYPRRSAVVRQFTTNANYVSIEGFEITGMNDGVLIRSDSVDVVDNYFHDIVGHGASFGIEGSSSDNIYIADNYMYTVSQAIRTSGNNWLVENNEVNRLSQNADYVRFFGMNQTFRGNYFHGSMHDDFLRDPPNPSDPYYHVDCFQTWGTTPTRDIVFEDNICIDYYVQGIISRPDGTTTHSDYTIRNNIFGGSTNSAEQAGHGVNVEDTSNVHIVNNVIANQRWHGVFLQGNSGATAVILNNIFYNLNDVVTGTANIEDFNVIYNVDDPLSNPGSNDQIGVDPLFVDPANYNFRLQEGSPARNAGTDTSSYGVVADIEGNQRPQGSAYDIGAYEYGGTGPPPGCSQNSDCDDGLFCNGDETCSNGNCLSGSNPCPGQSCDDVNDECVTASFPSDYASWWKFDDGSGATSFSDENGQNPGSCTGSACPIYTTGLDGSGAYSFDGIDDYIEFGTSAFGIDSTNEFTISLWINVINGDSSDLIITRNRYVDPFRVRLNSDNTLDIDTRFESGTILNHDSSIALTEDDWHHLALNYKDGVREIYIDGELDITASAPGQTLRTRDQTTWLGGTTEGGATWYLEAIFDNLMIYNRGLSGPEIQQIYCSQGGSGCQTYHRADMNQNGCIDGGEIGVFINRWYASTQDVSMVELVRALEVWKAPCQPI
jgi:hypothetical protein